MSSQVLATNRKKYHLTPPTGSVLEKFVKMVRFAIKHSPSMFKIDWEQAKPSNVAPGNRPDWMTYDDAWVDDGER